MREGDIVALKGRDGQIGIIKILRIDTAPVESSGMKPEAKWPAAVEEHSATYHCLCYAPVPAAPPLDQISSLPVMVMHASFASQAFDGAEILGNLPVIAGELEGFHEYLKQTDWARYSSETGFDADVELPRAKQFYLQANALGDEKRFAEAIEAYTAALDIFPMFMEALDNRGLTYMDMGDYRAGAQDFQTSLANHGENPVPLCSLGECYMKLGDKAAARKVFARCAEKWPDQPQFQRFLEMAADTKPASNPKASQENKPWWKFGRG